MKFNFLILLLASGAFSAGNQGDLSNDRGYRKCCGSGQVFDFTIRDCVVKDVNDNFAEQIEPRACEHSVVDYESNNISENHNTENECMDETTEPNKFVRKVCEEKSYCSKNLCISKCTPTDKNLGFINNVPMQISKQKTLHSAIMENNSIVFEQLKRQISESPNYGIYINDVCEIYPLPLNTNWTLDSMGYIRLSNSNVIYKLHEYCIDVILDEENILALTLFMCTINNISYLFLVKGASCMTSTFSLIVAVIVHLNSQTFGNLHSKCLLLLFTTYSTVFFSYGLTYFRVLNNTFLCKYWGFVIAYLCFSLFAWLNVISYNIWSLIKKSTQFKHPTRREDNIRLCLYCAYVFLIPTFFTGIIYLIDHYNLFSSDYQPNMGINDCWMSVSQNFGIVFYFLTPLLILIILNIIFFVLSFADYKIIKLQFDRITVSNYADLYNFQMYRNQLLLSVKIFTLMVCPFIVETILAVVKRLDSNMEGWYFYIFEFLFIINELQGVAITVLYITNLKKYSSILVRVLYRN